MILSELTCVFMKRFSKYYIFCYCLLFSTFLLAENTTTTRDINTLVKEVYFYKNKDDYTKSFNSLYDLLESTKSLNDSKVNAKNYYLHAYTLIQFNKKNEALHFLIRAKEIQEDIDDYESLVLTLNLKGFYELQNNSFKKAHSFFNKAEKIVRKKKLPTYLFKINSNRGILALKKRDFDSAIFYLKKALPISNSYEKKYLQATVLYNLSNAYYQKKDYENTFLYLDKALKIAKEENLPKIKSQSYLLYSQSYEILSNYEKALYYKKLHHNIKDSLQHKDRLNLTLQSFERTNSSFKKQLLQELEEDNETQQTSSKRTKIISVFIGALFIIISIIALSLQRYNKVKLITNDALMRNTTALDFSKKRAVSAMYAKSNLLSRVTHELRTPLYAVTGLTHLLLEEKPSENQKEYLESIKFSGEYLINFINDILQLNRIDGKKLVADEMLFNPQKLVQNVLNSLAEVVKKSSNDVGFEIQNSIPKYLIGDPLKLSQVFLNLVGNALKFTKNGEIKIILKTLNEDSNRARIHFEVKDTGIGIPKEVQEDIFETFNQGSTEINRKYGGTGLGLTIVRSLLKLMRSKITLESEINKGTTFKFAVTFKKTKAKDHEIEAFLNQSLEVDDEFLKGLHLLVVEDNKINQMVTRKILESKGISCDIAENGYQAIENAEKNQYDAILMDIYMPEMNGIEATQKIRKFKKDIPIIALTAIPLDENTAKIYNAGCDEIITKPFKPEYFYRTLIALISRYREKVKKGKLA